MKIMWLNDSLVLRGDSRDEKKALATVFSGLEPKDQGDCAVQGLEETPAAEPINPSI